MNDSGKQLKKRMPGKSNFAQRKIPYGVIELVTLRNIDMNIVFPLTILYHNSVRITILPKAYSI